MKMNIIFGILHVIICFITVLPNLVFGITDPGDASALHDLYNNWENPAINWTYSTDPCDTNWVGVICNNSRVISLNLPNMSISGTLADSIGQLTQLVVLDLSFNPGLTGPLTPRIGRLTNLILLALTACNFTGNIPPEIGNLSQLSELRINFNQFDGEIPASMGLMSSIHWLDFAYNRLTGSIPVSSGNTPGLDMLLNTLHFHFQGNQLSGPIPEQLFSSGMNLQHIVFYKNRFTGSIPNSIGLVKTLKILRLDRNFLNGSVPTNINNLTSLTNLNLMANQLTGPFPNLTGMNSLRVMVLGSNLFDPSEVPSWLPTLQAFTDINIQYGQISGSIPGAVFNLPQIHKLRLANNSLNNSLDMSDGFSRSLKLVDLRNNSIPLVEPNTYNKILMLEGNPVCIYQPANSYCNENQPEKSYTTSLSQCDNITCNTLEESYMNPQDCKCGYPLKGIMFFIAPSFQDISNGTAFNSIESTMWKNLSLLPNAVYISNVYYNESDDTMQLQFALFPPNGQYFSPLEVGRIAYALSVHTFKAPFPFGPYYLKQLMPYTFQDNEAARKKLSGGAVAGITIASCFSVFVVVGLIILIQKRRTRHASGLRKNDGLGRTLQVTLRGAKWFSFEEISDCTDDFSENNKIGTGGYGQVYKGILPNRQVIAIKRAHQASLQGEVQFKNEIELLSGVHHKNLVDLIGFCYTEQEQILVYEFAPNGTLRDNLNAVGRHGGRLNWKRRLLIALDSAQGLAYLHEHANPPIIHRDVKSTNILLDEHFTAKVADFGLSKLVEEVDKSHFSTQVKGTFGYMDPEYFMTLQLTEKSDVYSFGVVMLELITAKRPLERGKYLVHLVKMAIDEYDNDYYGLQNIMDPILQKETSVTCFTRFVQLALQCVQESADDRPTMTEIVKEIEKILHATETKKVSGITSSPQSFETGNNPLSPDDMNVYQMMLQAAGPKKHSDSSSNFVHDSSSIPNYPYNFASKLG